MKPTYLYVKTHNITGLKYFGKTVNDPYAYKGSGVRWLAHIKKHGNDVYTLVLNNGEPYLTEYDLRQDALMFSFIHNITSSTDWANLMVEDGFTGGSFVAGYSQQQYMKICERNRTLANRADVVEKKRVAMLEIQNRPAIKQRKSETSRARQNQPEHKQKQRELMKAASLVRVICEVCGKETNRQMYARWHGVKCKYS